jgi:cytoskeletal protein CcmA (bactofilin family)
MWPERKQDSSTQRTQPSFGNQPASAPGPVPTPAIRPASSTANVAVIGKAMVIKGQIHSSEDLYIDGEVQGELHLENCRLTVGPNGKLHCGTKARDVEILGQVDGNVETSEKIAIRKGGQLVGDVRTAGIVIEDGAYFKGSIDIMNQRETAVAAPKGEPAAMIA